MADAPQITQPYTTRWGALKNERASWMDQWKEISSYILPRSGRFFVSDRNRGEKRHNNIIDSTGTKSLRILAAGMMAGMTSPARPWFRLAIGDKELMDYAPVKVWLSDVTAKMSEIFQRSNSYRALHSIYEELGAFGTGASIIVEDFEDVIRHYPLTCGEYAIATDYRGVVTTLYREFDMTVAQMVRQFGIDRVSQTVRNLSQSGKGLDTWVTVVHAIEPRYDRDPAMRDAQNMPWKSCYFESGRESDITLRDSGFKEFAAIVPRWGVSGGDIYGTSPGMEALGDIKQLQHGQLRKAQGLDYLIKPPLQVPTGLKNTEVDSLPGGVAYYDPTSPNGGIRPQFEVRIDLNGQLEDIRDCRERIREGFYADLFLMMANDQRSGITATEVAERHEEKLLMLGPVLERLNDEMLNPKIEITFAKMVQAGLIPTPPQELQGVDLNVEFVSMLAQAQRAVGVNSVDRFLGTVGAIAGQKGDPSVWDNVDTDEIVDGYADMLGVDPHFIVASDKVAIVRKSRAQQQQAMLQQQQTAQAAQTAQTLSKTDTSGQNALTDVTRAFSGYT